MESILEIARKHNLPVIEDCAHSLFATQNGKYAGLFGDFSAFSFNHRKQLSTGQGGFLLINSPEYAEKSKDKGFGRIPARLNWNYAMPGIIAAIAKAQWVKAKGYVQKDYELANLYTEAVKGCEWLIPQEIGSGNWCAYHIWAALYKGDEFGINYEDFMKKLKENGADYFLPSFMPYGAFDLKPSPVYRYPIFNEPRAYTKGCPIYCPHYDGEFNYSEGACPDAEYLVPRLFNTVLSPIEDERIKRYAEGLHKTISQFS
jgi:perosamine synthetase